MPFRISVSHFFTHLSNNSQLTYIHTDHNLLHHHIDSDTTNMPIPNFQSQSSDKTTTANTPSSAKTTETQTGSGAGANTGAGVTREKTAAELEADRLYEEAMEEEYAKRDGGA